MQVQRGPYHIRLDVVRDVDEAALSAKLDLLDLLKGQFTYYLPHGPTLVIDKVCAPPLSRWCQLRVRIWPLLSPPTPVCAPFPALVPVPAQAQVLATALPRLQHWPA